MTYNTGENLARASAEGKKSNWGFGFGGEEKKKEEIIDNG